MQETGWTDQCIEGLRGKGKELRISGSSLFMVVCWYIGACLDNDNSTELRGHVSAQASCRRADGQLGFGMS